MLARIIAIMLQWQKVFRQDRTATRAMRQALSQVCVLGRRTIARSQLVRQSTSDWSSDYKLHTRSPWVAQDLFTPILSAVLAQCPGQFLPLGTDDTRLAKRGKKIATAHWGRDPLSPPFHVNLQWGLRFLHRAGLLPLHQRGGGTARALPVWFEEVAPVKKPGKKASAAEQQAYRQASKAQNLSTQTVAMMQQLRQRVDALGGREKWLAFALDGSCCNRTIFRTELARTIIIARTRKDAKLCFPVREGARRYSAAKFTPEQVRQDATRPWPQTKIYHGGKQRIVEYKEVTPVFWQRGAAQRPVRLLVVKPTPYRNTKQGRWFYRQPAYLLTTDLTSDATELLQLYVDRGQVEVVHRELKQEFGVGQAQVRVPAAVARQPVLSVATDSALHLAAVQTFGVQRPAECGPLPKYQREKTRASGLDLIRYVRHEVLTSPEVLPFDLKITANSLLASATI